LITRILISTKNESHFFKNFYAKRILLIFPLYFTFLAIYYYIIIPLSATSIAPVKDQLIFATYLQNIFMTFSNHLPIRPSHFWSLAVEEHFYLFWSFWVFLTNEKHLAKWLTGLICISVITRVLLVFNGYEVFYFTFTRLDHICMGALLAVIYLRHPSLLHYFKGKKLIFTLTSYVSAVAIIWHFTSGKGSMAIQVVKYLIIGLLYMVILGYNISHNNELTKTLSSSVMVYLGKISYGFMFTIRCVT
jgi:peptidoglycan/LPS O-acetylase OafA/YrhL